MKKSRFYLLSALVVLCTTLHSARATDVNSDQKFKPGIHLELMPGSFLNFDTLSRIQIDGTPIGPNQILYSDAAQAVRKSPVSSLGLSLLAASDSGTARSLIGAAISTSYVYRDLTTMATDAINSALVGKTTANEPIYSTRTDTGSGTYVRSATSWAAGFDLTSAAVYSANGVLIATAVTPRHVVSAHHAHPAVGQEVRFVTAGNVVVSRTIAATQQVGSTDVEVQSLNADLPASITPAIVLRASQEIVLLGAPVVFLDQNQAVFTGDVTGVAADGGAGVGQLITAGQSSNGTRSPFWKLYVSGDSSHPAYAVLDGKAILLGTAYSGNSWASIARNYDAINETLTSLGGGYQLTQYVAPTLTIGVGTTGADVSFAGNTLNVPNASTSNRGALTPTDWNTFNGKADTAANVGTGTGLFKQKANVGGVQQLQFNGIIAGNHVTVTPGSNGVTIDAGVSGVNPFNFLDLGDAPHSYSGQANKVVSVNPGATGLQFSNASQSGYAMEFRSDISTPSQLAALPTVSYTGFTTDGSVLGKMIQYVDTSGDGPVLVTYQLVRDPDNASTPADLSQPTDGITPTDYDGTSNQAFWLLVSKVAFGSGNFQAGTMFLPENAAILGTKFVGYEPSGYIDLQPNSLGVVDVNSSPTGTVQSNDRFYIFTGTSASYTTLGAIATDGSAHYPGYEVFVINAGTATLDIKNNGGTVIATLQPNECVLCIGQSAATWRVLRFERLGLTTITYSASMTPDAGQALEQVITATNSTAFTINAPTNPVTGRDLTVTIRNTSGGALGTATWNAAYKLSAWTQPANGFSRTITFKYNGTNWVEKSRTPADVPN